MEQKMKTFRSIGELKEYFFPNSKQEEPEKTIIIIPRGTK